MCNGKGKGLMNYPGWGMLLGKHWSWEHWMIGGNRESREVLVFLAASGKCRPKGLDVGKTLLCLHQMCLPQDSFK